MNGYKLIRDWYNFKFDNPDKVRHIHSDFYCYLVDQWNRLGQKQNFGLPTSVTMEALQIGSYNTYKKTLDDLIKWGFVVMVQESKNQHQSKIIALSNFDKATDKPTDKPTAKALDEATIKATDKPTDTIIEQYNNETIEQDKPQTPKRDLEYDFNKFLELLNKNTGKKRTVIPQKVKDKFKKALKEYTWKEIGTAVINASRSKHHIDSNYRYLTPEFFTRPDKIDMYAFESEKEQVYTGENAKLVNYMNKYLEGDKK